MRSGIIICLILFGCRDTEFEPENKIPDSTMVSIMTDLYALNAAFAQTFGTIKDSISNLYIKQIEEQYAITETQLNENLEYLRRNPAKLDSIFDRILDRIEVLESNIEEVEQ